MSGVRKTKIRDGHGDVRLDRWIKREHPQVSQGFIEKALRKGEIRVDGKRAKSGFRLQTGMEVRLPPLPDANAKPRPRPQIETKDHTFMRSLILHEDKDVFALNKPSGLAVQGGTGTKRHIDGMLPSLGFGGPPAKLVHRLDRDTSGVLLLGKNPQATTRLAKSFQGRAAQKTYLALVLGTPRPEEGIIKGYMKKGMGQKGREEMIWGRHGERDAQFSWTGYAVQGRAGQKMSLVALKPTTGRTHQLRFHMASIGHSVHGDHKYTCDRDTPGALPQNMMLHAWKISLPHPRSGKLEVTAPLPPHFAKALEQLGMSIPKSDPFEGLNE